MDYGICLLALVPMRAEASNKAEMVTQVLFGECYQVISQKDKWLQIQLATDNYRGWIDLNQHNSVSVAYFEKWKAAAHARVTDLLSFVGNDDLQIPVSRGAYLPFYENGSFTIENRSYTFAGNVSLPGSEISKEKLTSLAVNFLKTPYLWGGKSVFGIDCSGFVQQLYGLCGYQLPRDAYQQVEHGQEVHFATQTQPGDLAYFANPEGRIIHVGMMLENQQIIHAAGEVRIDTLDHIGIYRSDRKAYSHQLRIIKRIN